MYRYLIVILLVTFFQAQAQGIRALVKEGNEEYEKKEYENALNKYQDALLEDALNEQAIFNKGDALYQLKKYDEALNEYGKLAGSKDINLAAKAAYNMGNCYFQKDSLQASINAYVKSLELNPNDKDAKHNLELARAKLKEQAKKQKQNPNQQNKQNQSEKNKQQSGKDKQQQNDQQEQGNEQEQQQKEKQKQEQQQQNDKQGQKNKDKQDEEKKQQPMSEEDMKKMKPDDAKKILDALREEEQKSQENKPPIRARGRRGGKDW